MLHIQYSRKVNEAGVPVFDAFGGQITIVGRKTEDGWDLPNKVVTLDELTEEQKTVYGALAQGLAAAGESWVAKMVWANRGEDCVNLRVFAVQDNTGATKTFTAKDKPELHITEPAIIALYDSLHS